MSNKNTTKDMVNKTLHMTTRMIHKTFAKTKDVLRRMSHKSKAKSNGFWWKIDDPVERIIKYLQLENGDMVVKYYDDPKCSQIDRKSVWIRTTIDDMNITLYTERVDEKMCIQIEGITPEEDPIELGFNIEGNPVMRYHSIEPTSLPINIRHVLNDMLDLMV